MSATNAELADQAAPLDALLIDAALGPVRRFTPDLSTARWATSLARRPLTCARRVRDLASEAIGAAIGTSTLAPDKRDRRFTDPAWSENPFLRRIVQLYLAGGRTVDQLVVDAELDWRDEQRVRFLVENLTAAMSPSNVPLLNPTSAKVAIDTAGMSLVQGRHAAGQGPGLGSADPRDGRHSPATRWGATSRPRRAPSCCGPRSSSCCSTPRRPRRSTRSRCSSYRRRSTSSTRSTWRRSAASSSSASGRAGRCSSCRGATRTGGTRRGTSTPTRRRSWRPWTPSSGSPAASRPSWAVSAPAASWPASPPPTSPRPAGWTGWRRSASP